MSSGNLPKFTMTFDPKTINHLGMRLYSQLPPVLSELITNAWDADSTRVELTIPNGPITPSTEIIIRDYGHSLTEQEIQDEYLPIARDRREKGSNLSKSGRRVTGRKGLGKLSAFGIARELQVRAIKNGEQICFVINYDEISNWSKQHRDQPYEPRVLEDKTGPTQEADGIELTIRSIKRKTPIKEEDLRRQLARRLNLIGGNFEVVINGNRIKPADRIQQTDCEPSWDLADTGPANSFDCEGETYQVAGWIGFLAKSSQTNRGLDIYASGKSAQLECFFNLSSTHAQFARTYMVGQIQADFLDEAEDLISSSRTSVLWEEPLTQAFQDWGQCLVRWATEQWLADRQQKREEKIIRLGKFDEWLSGRTNAEKRIAERLVKMLAKDETLDPVADPNPDAIQPLLEIVKSSIETKAFHELASELNDQDADIGTILKLFRDWRVIESRELLTIADGRRNAIEQLQKYIEEGALEVKEMQPLFREQPWMINAAWQETDFEVSYSTALQKQFEEPELDGPNRRIDILGMAQGNTLHVVEIKRPESTLNVDHLRQIEDYVDWAKTNLMGTGDSSISQIFGLLIVGKMGDSAKLKPHIERCARDNIRVETYHDMHRRAINTFQKQVKVLREIAPEYNGGKHP